MLKIIGHKTGIHFLIAPLAAFAVLILACTAASSQVRYRVAAGLSTDWITNNNPATYRITGHSSDLDSNKPFGGGFDGMQMGWGIKGFIDIDKQKRFRIPVGLDYFMYSGAQSFGATRYRLTARHEVDLYTGIVGFEWAFAEFPMAFARAYIGGEARLLYVTPNVYQVTFEIRDSILIDRTVYPKPAATRLGAMVRLGIEGEVYYPVFVNTSVAWGAMNLVGRDEVPGTNGGRGELLTVNSDLEGAESIVMHLNFTFMVQVRL
ncbi:MAG: hypothetical protein HYX66_09900 [Ignavibacteria bacterium]|nr:hypothetical protein [Ignavibacteria bacterium]